MYTSIRFFAVALLIALIAYMIALLLQQTVAKEGFVDKRRKQELEDVENPLTPQQFSYELLQSVMGPIRRLSSRITNIQEWKERFELTQMTPVDLARRHYKQTHQKPSA